jgi:hypothetical protein
LTGAYLLKDVEGDTDLVCQLAVDAGIPLFTDASVQQILISHIHGTLSRIKAVAERDLVRLVPRRSRLTDAAAPATEPAALPADSEEEEEDGAIAEASTEPDAGPVKPVGAGGGAEKEPSVAAAQQRAGRRGRRRRRPRGERPTRPAA